MNDYVSVKDKADPSVVHKVPKLLLQIMVQELHIDLIKQLPEASKDGVPLILDTKLREMIPPKKCVDAVTVLVLVTFIVTTIYTPHFLPQT